MLHELEIEQWTKVANLFESHILNQSIINPCVRSGMGYLSVDNIDSPNVAMYSAPMMIFLAGDAANPNARELVTSIPQLTGVIVPDKEWSDLLKNEWGDKVVVNQRTHLDHRSLSIEHLKKLKENLPAGYILKKMDREVLPQISQQYTMQIQMNFGKIENLIESGFGFCILHDDRLVSYAYTAFPFIDEFEIQVFTENSSEYRRKGLATTVSAALIEYGLENNLVPHWDAANESSIKLAMKLGYTNPISWEAYYYKE
ncbi:MAG: GNAT family N-acetyltransferase [Candidatus Thorarchaeota archaeon]